MDQNERCHIVEAILFVAGGPVEKAALQEALELSSEALEEILQAMVSEYDEQRRGIRLLCYGASVQMTTRPDYALYVEKLLQPVQKQSLSQAVLETLAIVAYKQPVTRAEMELIRGVKCDYSVQALQNRGLIQEVGRKETLGRPILYGTTDAFLRHFGITSLEQLPKLDFQAAAKKMQEDAKKIEGSMDAETRA